MNRNFLFGLITVLFIVIFTSCSSSVDLAVDNPTEKPITVTIDELTVEIPSKEVVWVEMGKGEHTVTLEDGTTHPFNYVGKAYMLNPTMSEYLVVEEFFGSQASYMAYEKTYPSSKVEFMGMEMEGRYQVVNELVNPVTWDVGAREQMPESIEADESASYVVLKKLMSSSEYMDLMMEALKSRLEEAPQEQG